MTLDFSRLANAPTAEEREQQEREFTDSLRAQIAERSAEVRRLAALAEQAPERFSEWEREFIDSMVRRAERCCLINREVGGELASLSDKQVERIGSLSNKHPAEPSNDNSLSP